MKYVLAFICMSYTFIPAKTNRELFDDFHTIFAKGDFKAMDVLLADSFFGLDESGSVSFRKPDYIEYMSGWNQVFKTKWNVESVEETGTLIKSIEYDTDMWNDYFYGDQKMRYRYTYAFNKAGDKITSIRVDTLPGTYLVENAYMERYKKFYEWMAVNHPEKLEFCKVRNKQCATEVKVMLEQYLSLIK